MAVAETRPSGGRLPSPRWLDSFHLCRFSPLDLAVRRPASRQSLQSCRKAEGNESEGIAFKAEEVTGHRCRHSPADCGVFLLAWREYTVANAQAAQTREIIDSVDKLLLSLVDAETGQRGFLLTGEDQYLEPYNQAIQIIPAELAKLNQTRCRGSSDCQEATS
jgi:CHASE3 domain